MFKVGDRVICRDANDLPSQSGLRLGYVYTVTRVNIFSEQVQVDNINLNFRNDRFVLVINEQSPYSIWEKGNTSYV